MTVQLLSVIKKKQSQTSHKHSLYSGTPNRLIPETVPYIGCSASNHNLDKFLNDGKNNKFIRVSPTCNTQNF